MMQENSLYPKCVFSKAEIHTVSTKAGKKLEFILAGNILWPTYLFTTGFAPDIRQTLEEIKCMKCRDDDVIICAYPRSGTHWVWEICNMLLKGKAEVSALPKQSTTLEYHKPGEFESLPSTRIFNTHLHFDCLPQQIVDENRGGKIVFITRNPKDVAVSLFHHANNQNGANKFDFNTFLEAFQSNEFMYKWFAYTKEFENAIPKLQDSSKIHIVHYEDLKQEPDKEIRKLATFLGTDDKLLDKLVEKSKFKEFKKASDNLKDNNHCRLNTVFKDPKLTVRKGQIGDWKNYFTVMQSEKFDAIYKERMQNSALTFTYSSSSR